jgi:hypothetical protein
MEEEFDTALVAVATPAMPEFSSVDLVKLAREVAMDIKDLAVVLEHYKLTQEQYDHLKENHEFFKQALHVSVIEWNSALTTAERIKLESAAILEDALPRLGARMANAAEGLPGVVEAAKLFAKIAGLGEKEQTNSAPGEKFTIRIDLGGDNRTIKDVTPQAIEIESK